MFISYDRVDILTKGTPLNVGDGVNFSAELGDDTRLAIYAQATMGTTDLRLAESFITEALVKEKLGEVV
ncbi:hypothetical protein LCGC14_2423490 [marine sediment metagenome]|uniref:Uncharacterized protein n=1 Tax=marine sediment metagenome TaxID=412755 RepID=A0A0F9BP32_9ZZZZ